MAQTNVQLMEALYAAFGRGDAAAVLGSFDPGIVWKDAENFEYADRNPYVGPQQIAEGIFGRIMSEWEGFTVAPEEFVADNERVVSTGRYTGTYKATGAAVNAQFVHVWTIRDGKVTKFQQYTDTLQFARVMGTAAH